MFEAVHIYWGIVGITFMVLWVLMAYYLIFREANFIDPDDQCPHCLDTALIRLSSLEKSICSGCGSELSWDLKEGQPPLVSSNRDRRKYRKKEKDHGS